MSTSGAVSWRNWNSLPSELHDLILARVELAVLFKVFRECKSLKKILRRDSFKRERAHLRLIECTLSPLILCVKRFRCYLWGYDWKDRSWLKLPPFTDPIPTPSPDLFKDFVIAGNQGLICLSTGELTEPEKLFVFNPLTGERQQLPPLNYSRHPVVISLHVTDPGRGDFQVIAVGSAVAGTGHLSRKTEVYFSNKRRWEVADDVPGEQFSVNEYQTGVYCEAKNLLLYTGFTLGGSKGILAFDLQAKKWRANWICSFHRLRDVHPASTIHFAITQLVECSGVIYLFSEQETNGSVTHCIDKLNFGNDERYTWTRRLTVSRGGIRALLAYPEFTCAPVEGQKLCIFNTVQLTGEVYDMSKEVVDPCNYESLLAPPVRSENGDKVLFFSLNPVNYHFQPSFGAVLPYSEKNVGIVGV